MIKINKKLQKSLYKKPIEVHGCKKIVLLMVLLISICLFLPKISAIEWDNIKYYDEETKTITIKNSFLKILPLDTLVEEQSVVHVE